MKLFDSRLSDDGLSTGKRILLGLQHGFTMFGATVLVPIATGMDVSVALFMVGIGTLIFHLITRGKVPAFMGSSFAFIAPMAVAIERFGYQEAQSGLVAAGILYILFGILIYFVGPERVMSFFPPIVTGPIIIVIGLTLAPTALNYASENWLLAVISFAIVVIVNLFAKGFLNVLPVLFGLAGGYIVAALTGNINWAEIAEVARTGIFGLPNFTVAKFSWGAILSVAPVVLVTMVEHIGDIVAIGATVGEDLVEDPGLHRTMVGDGVAVVVSSLFGGPANTTYSENTGVLALTRVYNPAVMRIAAVFSILLSVVPVFGAIISSIPNAVIGGISIVLFGMISAVGVRTLVENQVDFQSARNLIIAAVILVIGLGSTRFMADGNSASIFALQIGETYLEISGMAVAALAGIVLNKILPEKARREE